MLLLLLSASCVTLDYLWNRAIRGSRCVGLRLGSELTFEVYLSKMYLNVSSRCHYFKKCPGSVIHGNIYGMQYMTWLEILLDITPIRYFLSTDQVRTLDPVSVKRAGIISYIVKKRVLFNKYSQHFTFIKPPWTPLLSSERQEGGFLKNMESPYESLTTRKWHVP